jgi:tRNA A-37 threonylcarbamoyl transferase component Bud32
MQSLVGQTVSHYVFLEKLGAGGMGEIYKARDSRLNRIVAVKVLEPAKTRDPDRRRRFIQEAQAASALNHPNIITIFDILPEGDTQYMVLEYVAGKTLHDLISAHKLPIPQVLQLATQMANALGAAHAAGIVHRDFKPANVMVTASGLVKVLDFGLAKLNPATPPDAEQDTLTAAPLTREGVIMGTVNYMSPEQAEGLKVDGRSDMFSFGTVLYEMITGKRAFQGDSGISTLSAVLRDEPKPMHQIVPDVPPEIADLVERCLRKNPSARLESMIDVETTLEVLRRRFEAETPPQAAVASEPTPVNAPTPVTAPAEVFTPVAGLPPQPTQRRTGALKLVLLGMAAVAVIALAVFLARWSSKPKPQPVATVAQAPVPSSSPAVPQPEPSPAPAPAATEPPKVAAPPPPPPAAPAPPKVEKLSPAPKSVITPAPAIAPAAASVPTVHPASPAVVVPIQLNDGLPFRIELLEDVPIDAALGRPLRFRVMDGVKSGDTTVIAKGSTVTGSLVDLGGKRKFLGERSKVRFNLIAADSVDDAKISVRATPGSRADGDESRPFATPNATKDKNLIAASGTQYVAYISGDQTVSVHQ